MIKEAIILAGGLGTRLRKVVKDIPKPMAEINGRPFLVYLLKYLSLQGIEKVILSVGYKHEVIINYFGSNFENLKLIYSIEEAPLGTGGAIKKSLNYLDSEEALILNGDTLFEVNLHKFYNLYKTYNTYLSIALKKVKNPDRYGIIEIDKNFKIKKFYEKGIQKKEGLINGGIYFLNKVFFASLKMPNFFSFERDFLEKYYQNYDFYGFPCEGYFIDIGIPEDYEKAKEELKNFET